MATNFSNMGCEQLRTYAAGGVRDAVKAGCPKAKQRYQNVLDAISQTLGGLGCSNPLAGTFIPQFRQGLEIADSECHAEAYPAGSTNTSTGTRVVTPELKNTTVPGVAKAGMSPWLLVGGLGLLALLFGKKKR